MSGMRMPRWAKALLMIAAMSAKPAWGRQLLRAHKAVAEQSSILGRKQPFRQTLHNYQNVQYFADFKIGGQDIPGIFDTGSFELLVRSSRCDKCVHPTPPYDRTKSQSYMENGTITKHVFGSGPCVSMMGYETVQVGDMVAKEQAFWEIVSHQITVLNKAKFAAIVGIGPNFAYGHTEQTLLMSYGVEEFSICLQKKSGSPGFLTWGPVANKEEKEKKFAKADVVGEHHWVARLHNISFGEKSEAHLANMPCMGSGCAAIVDSGTSLIAAPGVALMQLSEMIEPIKEDCSNIDELPTLHFVIDGKDFELPPQAYIMRVTGAILEADSIWDVLFFKPKIRKLDMCMPAFMQIDMMSQFGPVWILGMPFFRYYHTIFDREERAMYFAKAGPNCEALPYQADRSTELLSSSEHRLERQPMEVDVDSLVPPTLSGMIDYPYSTKGELML
mmetsp:Transcript_65219/g.155767  ORF Transcript_65219/g.155767 Transcript_65219/m.155767 type:complete len:445 (+) Transcript_65219:74-1408(+)